MKKIIIILFLFFSFNVVFSAPKVGVGVGFNNSIFADEVLQVPVGLSTFQIPVFITEKIRLQPELSFYSNNYTDKEEDKEERSTSMNRYGIAGHYSFINKDNYISYGGVMFGMSMLSQTSEQNDNEVEQTQNNFYMGLLVGGEYFFSDYFSLGAELMMLISMSQMKPTFQTKVLFMQNSILMTKR